MQVHRPRLLQALIGRFGLESGVIRRLALGGRLNLVSDADEAVAEYARDASTQASAAASVVQFNTVPADERWTVYRMFMNRSGGDRNTSAVYAYDASGNGDQTLDSFTAASTYESNADCGLPIKLEPNDAIRYYFTGGAADGNWTSTIWVRKEKIRYA
jgi:hypothetical protein